MFITGSNVEPFTKPISGGKSTEIGTHIHNPTIDGRTLANQKGSAVALTGVTCADFENSDDDEIVSTASVAPRGDWYVECYYYPDAHVSYGEVVLGGAGTNDQYIGTHTTSGRLRARVGGTAFLTSASNTIPTGEWSRIVSSRSGSNITFTVYEADGTQRWTETLTANDTLMTAGTLKIGGVFSGRTINGKLSNVIVGNSSTDTILHYPLAEGNSNTRVYDISGNGNHATITSVGYTTLNDLPSHNHQYGFSTAFITEKSPFSGTNCTGAINADGALVVTSTADSGVAFTLGSPISLTGNVTLSYDCISSDGGQVSANINFNDLGSFWMTSDGSSSPSANVPNGSFSESATISSDQEIGLKFNLYTYLTTGQTITISNLTVKPASNTCRIPALPTSTQIATFDGADSNIQLANSGQGSDFAFGSDNFTIEGKADLTDEGSDRILISRYLTSGNLSWIVLVASGSSGGNFSLGTSNDGSNVTFAPCLKANVPQSVTNWKIVKTGTVVQFYFDDVLTATSSAEATLYDANANVHIGGHGTNGESGVWDRGIHSIKVTNDTSNTVILDMDFSGDIGTTTATSSHVGTNHDGTIANATLTSFWGKRDIDTSGGLVSADYAVGNTSIPNPNGLVHNGSECSITLPTAGSKTYAQLLAVINTHPLTNQLFVRKESNGNIKAIVELPSAASAGAKEEILNYVGQ